MGGVERTGHLGDDRCGELRLQPVLARHLLEVRAGHEPHRDVEQAIDLTGIVNRKRMRMVDRGGELPLASEAGPEIGIRRELRRDQLEGALALELQMRDAVDDTHAPAGHQLLDPMPGDDGPGRKLPHGAGYTWWLAGGRRLDGRRIGAGQQAAGAPAAVGPRLEDVAPVAVED